MSAETLKGPPLASGDIVPGASLPTPALVIYSYPFESDSVVHIYEAYRGPRDFAGDRTLPKENVLKMRSLRAIEPPRGLRPTFTAENTSGNYYQFEEYTYLGVWNADVRALLVMMFPAVGQFLALDPTTLSKCVEAG